MEPETLKIDVVACCANCGNRHGTYKSMKCAALGELFSVLPHWVCDHYRDIRGAKSFILDLTRARAEEE